MIGQIWWYCFFFENNVETFNFVLLSFYLALSHWQVSVSEVFKEITLEMQVTETVQERLSQATKHIHVHKYSYRPVLTSSTKLWLILADVVKFFFQPLCTIFPEVRAVLCNNDLCFLGLLGLASCSFHINWILIRTLLIAKKKNWIIIFKHLLTCAHIILSTKKSTGQYLRTAMPSENVGWKKSQDFLK